MSKMLRWLGHPRAPRFVAALALVLALPSLAVGFLTDDYPLIDWLEHRLPFSPPWWDLYHFTPDAPDAIRRDIATGDLPWWTAPALHLHLVRPFASVLLALDHAAFGRAAVGWHLHSLAWYALLLAAAGLFFRRLLPPATATFALIVFAFSDANVLPFAWPSARHHLLAAICAVLGLTAHVRYRSEGWRAGRLLAPLALVVGLLASEAGLGGFAFAIAYDLVGLRRGGWRDRVLRALPLAALALMYLVVYSLVGGGARGSGAYVWPSDPTFLATAALRVPVLLGDVILGIPADFASRDLARGLAITGALATVLFAWLWRACRRVVPEAERATLSWLALGAFASLAASVGGFPGSRVLLVANLGFAPVMATVLVSAFPSGPFVVARRAGAGLLAIVHVVLAPLSQVGSQRSMQAMSRATVATAHAFEQEIGGRTRAFVVTASDPMAGMYARFAAASEASGPLGCRALLSAATADVTITRTGDASFALRPSGTTFLRGAFEDLYRAPWLPMHVGEEVTVCGARVRVTDVEEGLPSRIEVHSDVGLDSPTVAWLVWDAGALSELTFPAVGESTTIAWTPGPSGVF
jgi:hypothetical protein